MQLLPALFLLTVPALQGQVDAVIETKLTGFVRQQEQYRLRFRPFFQGLVTVEDAQLPDNQDVDPSPRAVTPNVDRRPPDHRETWRQAGFDVAGIPASVEIHNYGGPRGEGWVLITRVKHGGRLYYRIRNFGRETGRESGWQEIIPR